MKILGIIPARAGSKGVPGKNIKLLGDKPLIAYTAISSRESSFLTDTIISTDSEVIANVAAKYNIQVPFIRPAGLATDKASSIDVVIHAVEALSAEGRRYDAVCLLQPTHPFRQQGFIDKAIKKFIEAGTDSLISVLAVPAEFNPHWVFEVTSNGNLAVATGDKEIITRRQDLPEAFYRDGNIYLTKISSVLDQRSLYGKSISYIESDPRWHVNIDTPHDWELATEIVLRINSPKVDE
ncbi:MAG: acylneuraminate cytidylyltransferase family protein [Ginsengibacter sp.]